MDFRDFIANYPQPPRMVPRPNPPAVVPKSGKKARAGLVCVSCERTDADLKKLDGKDYPKNYVFFNRDTKETLRLDWSLGYGQLVCVECSENAYEEGPCRFCGIPIECCPILSQEDYDNYLVKKHKRHCGIQLRIVGEFNDFEAVLKPPATIGPMDACDKCLATFGPTYYQEKLKSPETASEGTTPKVSKVTFHPEPAVEVPPDDVRVTIDGGFEDDCCPSVLTRYDDDETPSVAPVASVLPTRFDLETLGEEEEMEEEEFVPLTRTKSNYVRPTTAKDLPGQSI